MRVAYIYAKLSYCKRRQVGCVVVKENRIISIGYNGTPSGWPNICEDENNKTFPYVYHAETNAISKLARSNESGREAAIFITTNPCLDCAKLIAQTGIKEVYYTESYRDNEGIEFLRKSSILVIRFSPEEIEITSIFSNPDQSTNNPSIINQP